MKWSLKSSPVNQREIPFFNQMYLNAQGLGGPDSTIVWTSEIPWEPLQHYVRTSNQRESYFISSTHLLVQAVSQALVRHPEINRRVVGRRVYEYSDCNVCLATRVPNSNEVHVIQLPQSDQLTVSQIARIVSRKQIAFARGTSPENRDCNRFRRLPHWLRGWLFRTAYWLDRWFVLPVIGRVDRLRESVVLINDFSHPRFPVMRAYKPSRQPGESKPLSVTLGRAENRVVWESDRPTPRWFAPISIRVDHRICDSFQLAQFINTLCQLLSQPAHMNAGVPTTVGESSPRTDQAVIQQSA